MPGATCGEREHLRIYLQVVLDQKPNFNNLQGKILLGGIEVRLESVFGIHGRCEPTLGSRDSF